MPFSTFFNYIAEASAPNPAYLEFHFTSALNYIALRRSCSQKIEMSYMKHHSSLLWEKVAIQIMAIINTFGPVLMNDQCIGYMLADHS